jgi:hypothetical protein
MRLWPRRKVIYTYDDNFAPTVDFLPGPYVDIPFRWYCPDDAYIRLTCVNGWHECVAGVRPSMIMHLCAYRGHQLRFRGDVMIGIANVGIRAFVVFAGAPRFTTTSTGYTRERGMPPNFHMVPGDSITVESSTVIPGDNYFDVAVSYDRWEL